MKRRKRIKIELTTQQIDKLWPFFQAVAEDNLATWNAERLAVMGQAWVKDDDEPGRVRGWAQFTLLTEAEAEAVAMVLKGEGAR